MAKEIRIRIEESPAKENYFFIRIEWPISKLATRQQTLALTNSENTLHNFYALHYIFSEAFDTYSSVVVDVYTDKGQEIKKIIQKTISTAKRHLGDNKNKVRHLGYSEDFKIGDSVKISEGSGLDSGKIATVVARSKIITDGRGIPKNVTGAYKPVDWKREIAIQFEDGTYGTMFKSRLIKQF